MKIIVARYNESIEWTKEFSNVIVYNKGEKLNIDNEIMLENVGREGHTYYKYIYDNYDNLDDYTIFLQGNPFDHSPDLINDLWKYINDDKLDLEFRYLSKVVVLCKLNGCRLHPELDLMEVYEKIFDEKGDREKHFRFGFGAQFIISKKKILSRPRDFYMKIIKLLDYHINPIEGYVIERFHRLIFSMD